MCLPRSSLELVLLSMNTDSSHLVLLVLVLDMCSFFIYPSSSYIIYTPVLVSLIYLSTDIRNAFNNCDRALLLEKLYNTEELRRIFPIVNFAYSSPSKLLLHGNAG